MGVSIALIHYPVKDKKRDIVSSSITNFDIHDIARSATTYGVRRYFVVTPIPSQQWLAERIIKHWREGFGAEYNQTRREAMLCVSVVSSLDDVFDAIKSDTGLEPLFVATSAQPLSYSIKYEEFRKRILKSDEEFCITFGTGWGLHPTIIEEMDFILEPIYGVSEYNHLSVRAAVGIILDRLLGKRE